MPTQKPSNFSPEQQLHNLDARLILSLQRLSDILKAMQWDQARTLGLTPLQLQILLFTGYHPAELNKVAHIATELQLSRPTISDAVASLVSKGLLDMQPDKRDRRSFSMIPTPFGREILLKAEEYVTPLAEVIEKRPGFEKNNLYQTIFAMIAGLMTKDSGGLQRMCYNCAHYQGNKKRQHNCLFLKRSLASAELQIDCMYHSTLS
jgi:DNA-binding MarR family transcriptional regulator